MKFLIATAKHHQPKPTQVVDCILRLADFKLEFFTFRRGPGGLRVTIGEDFGRLGVPLDLHLGVLGCPWASILGVDAFGESSQKIPPQLFQHTSVFDDFGGQRVPRRMELQSLKNQLKNRLNFCLDF